MSHSSSSSDDVDNDFQKLMRKEQGILINAELVQGDEPNTEVAQRNSTETSQTRSQHRDAKNDKLLQSLTTDNSELSNAATASMLERLGGLDLSDEIADQVRTLRSNAMELTSLPGFYHALQEAGLQIDLPPQSTVHEAREQLQASQDEMRKLQAELAEVQAAGRINDESMKAKDARLDEYALKAGVTALKSQNLMEMKTLFYSRFLHMEVPSDEEHWLTPRSIIEHIESIDLGKLTDDPKQAWLDAVYTKQVQSGVQMLPTVLAVDVLSRACVAGEVKYDNLVLLVQNLDNGSVPTVLALLEAGLKEYIKTKTGQQYTREEAFFVLRGIELLQKYIQAQQSHFLKIRELFAMAQDSLQSACGASIVVDGLNTWLDTRFQLHPPPNNTLGRNIALKARGTSLGTIKFTMPILHELFGENDQLVVLQDPDYADYQVKIFDGSQFILTRSEDLLYMLLDATNERGDRLHFSFDLTVSPNDYLIGEHFEAALLRYCATKGIV